MALFFVFFFLKELTGSFCQIFLCKNFFVKETVLCVGSMAISKKTPEKNISNIFGRFVGLLLFFFFSIMVFVIASDCIKIINLILILLGFFLNFKLLSSGMKIIF